RTAGFDNINVDLIFNVPGQSLVGWQADLRRAMALAPEHISAYSLTVEPGTGLAQAVATGEVTMPPEDMDHDMFAATRDLLGAGGYSAYEISNFAREGWACRHNLHYWRIEPYLGCGPAAHGFDGRQRYWNVRDLDKYMAAIEAGESPRDGSETLTDIQLANEKLLFGLRLTEGISVVEGLGFNSVEAFRRQFAGPLERWSAEVEISNGRLRTTAAGVFLADGIAADFM
ncbi:MAG: coproporphyrinogen III oxidase, partial [Candidatus Neomarinimicrobiota bacterium]